MEAGHTPIIIIIGWILSHTPPLEFARGEGQAALQLKRNLKCVKLLEKEAV
jgi:hypothetical protein